MRATLLLVLAVLGLAAGCVLPGVHPRVAPYYEEVLGGAPFTRLVVQVDHAPGRAPSEAAKAHLLGTLKNVTRKTHIVLDVKETLKDEPGRVWKADDLLSTELALRRARHEAPTALLHVLYPAGRYEGGSAAGVTISGPVIGPVVVFLDVLRELRVGTPLGALPVPNPEAGVQVLERSTLLHEAGHAMGLVNNGLLMVKAREDKENEGHTTNPRSVMYWAVESQNGLRQYLLDDGSVPDVFDADDLADLRSAGGR
jgi:hypothetical protein